MLSNNLTTNSPSVFQIPLKMFGGIRYLSNRIPEEFSLGDFWLALILLNQNWGGKASLCLSKDSSAIIKVKQEEIKEEKSNWEILLYP